MKKHVYNKPPRDYLSAFAKLRKEPKDRIKVKSPIGFAMVLRRAFRDLDRAAMQWKGIATKVVTQDSRGFLGLNSRMRRAAKRATAKELMQPTYDRRLGRMVRLGNLSQKVREVDWNNLPKVRLPDGQSLVQQFSISIENVRSLHMHKVAMKKKNHLDAMYERMLKASKARTKLAEKRSLERTRIIGQDAKLKSWSSKEKFRAQHPTIWRAFPAPQVTYKYPDGSFTMGLGGVWYNRRNRAYPTKVRHFASLAEAEKAAKVTDSNDE